MNTEEIVYYIIDLFTDYLKELSKLKRTEFIHGEMTAYVETLEILQQHWNKAKIYGLNYEIEEIFEI